MTRPNSYEFGRFRVDVGERTLLHDGAPLPLTQKTFDVLLALVERGGRLVSKEELMREVWQGQYVEEGNLTQHIYTLRRVLGGAGGEREYIETVPRRGYRFKLPVEERHEEGPAGVGEAHDEAGFTPPATHYVRNGEVNIAYQVLGDGPLDIVFVMGWVSHLEYFWREASFARFLRRLASFSRLILFDKRGTGLSDRVPVHELPTLEQRMDDVRGVMEAVGSERAALVGVSEGGPMSALFAATYPERTAALVMIGTYAKRVWDEQYPWAPTVEEREEFYREMQEQWGGPVGVEERAPSVASDPQFRRWWAEYLRMGASPGAAVALTRMNADIDVRSVLPTIRVPTLVIHRAGDECLRVEEGRYVAGLISGARYVELPGEDHLPFVGDQNAILDEIEEFLTGVRHEPEPDRVLATVLFLSLGGRAAQAARRGEGRDGDLLARLRAHVSREIGRFRGREVDAGGAGPLATFDGPARAVLCACAVAEYASRLGVGFRAGLHTGECDRLAGGRVGGVAVEIGRAVRESAAPGEVLVSSTVKDLVAGSGIRFEERGVHSFGAVSGEWRLFRVERCGGA